MLRGLRKRAAVAAIIALAASLLAAVPAGAQNSGSETAPSGFAEARGRADGEPAASGVVAQGSSGLCDVSGVSQFGDVAPGGYGAAHILCARALGLTRGKADGTYGPDDDLTREQMSAFLVRLWRDVLGGDCPQGVSHGFADVAGSFAEPDIKCLFGLGVTKGTTASTFSPGATLSTAAVTLFVARLLVRSGAATCDLSADEFERAAVCLAGLGVAASADEALAPVAATRAMMAVYLVGAWHHASGRGQPPVSATRPVVSAVVTNDAPLVVDHPAGLSVSVPVGALPDSARLVVTEVTAVPPASDRVELAGPVLDVRVFSASGREITELDAPAQLRLPVPPGGGEGVVIAYYHEVLQTWVPVATRAEDGDLVAELDHFTLVVASKRWNRFKRLWGSVKEFWNSHVVATRIPEKDRPKCAGTVPGWVVSDDLIDEHGELLACAFSRGDALALKVANNRGYPIVVRQGGTGAVAEPGDSRSVVTELYQWLYGLFYSEQPGDTVLRGLEEVSFGLNEPQTADGRQQTTKMHALSEEWGWVFSLVGTAIDTAIPAEEVGDVLDVLLERVPSFQGAVCGTKKAEASVVQCAIDRLAQVTEIITDRLQHNHKLLAKVTRLLGTVLSSLNPLLGAISKGIDILSGAAKAIDLLNSIDDNDPIEITYQTKHDTPTDSPVDLEVNPSGNTTLSAGWWHSCGVRDSGSVECWGYDSSGESSPPPGGFTSVSAGGAHSCGLRSNSAATCWGDNEFGQTDVPDGSFKTVSAGFWHSCGVLADNTIGCWGDNDYGQSTPPSGTFTSVSAAWEHSCGLRADGTVTCWGRDRDGKASAPSGIFASVSAGRRHSCGLRTDGTVTCWGDNDHGQTAAPAGDFVAVSAGRRHSCALRGDGKAICWGNNDHGQTRAPMVAFTSVSAGYDHSCGLRSDRTVSCWGGNDYGEASPPGGVFAQPPTGSTMSAFG